MKTASFSVNSPGKLIPVTGVRGVTHAFVPDPLPPAWEWPDGLWPLLRDAHSALARLDGAGMHLPNPELILRPLQNREAQKSSSLEGTVTDPQEQLLFNVDPRDPSSRDDPVNALREVANYVKALRLWKERREQLPLSLRLVRELHAVLMTGVRGADQNPGEFRRLQNQIGRPARYVPPPATALAALLDSFEKYLHRERALDPLVEVFLVHYQFEAIHPFMDGNGRVGRLLLGITVREWCGMSSNWLYMSDYFDRNKDRYIDLLFDVSATGDWHSWIEFCLEGVVEQANDTLDRCSRLIDLSREFHTRAKEQGGSVRLSTLIDSLFEAPVITVTGARDKLGVAYPTARDDLLKLAGLGVIQRVESRRPITYYAPEIMDVTFAD